MEVLLRTSGDKFSCPIRHSDRLSRVPESDKGHSFHKSGSQCFLRTACACRKWHKGFDLSTIQVLITTLFVYEPAIKTLHPLVRKGFKEEDGEVQHDSVGQGDFFCVSLRRGIRLSENTPTDGAEEAANRMRSEARKPEPQFQYDDLHKVFLALSSLNTIKKINDCLAEEKFKTYNLAGVCTDTNGKFIGGKNRTVEFRQHISTRYLNRVRLWMRFCTAMVSWAVRISSNGGGNENTARLLRVLKTECGHLFAP